MTMADAEAIERVASVIFRRCNYNGDDGRLVWEIAALVNKRRISEAEAFGAAKGVKLAKSRPTNPIGYLRTSLTRECAKRPDDRAIELEVEIRRLKWPDRWSFAVPDLRCCRDLLTVEKQHS